MYLNYTILKLLFKYYFDDEFAQKIKDIRTKKSIESARMISEGLPDYKCYIVDFFDDDFVSLNFSTSYGMYVLTDSLNDDKSLEEFINLFCIWYFEKRDKISIKDYIETIKERDCYRVFKDITSSKLFALNTARNLPTILVIEMGNINVRSSAGINVTHKGFYSFVYTTGTMITICAARNIYEYSEIMRGYVHPHVSPYYMNNIDSEKLFKTCGSKVNIEGKEYINSYNIRNVCLGDSDLGNFLSQYSISDDEELEMLCIMISSELTRIFNSENDNSTNFPYIRMSEIKEIDMNGLEKVSENICDISYTSYNPIICNIAKYIYTNNLFHFIINENHIKCTDSVYYIMDTITKAYISVSRDICTLSGILDCTIATCKYVTDGMNVYLRNSNSSSYQIDAIKKAKELNSCLMFSYAGKDIAFTPNIYDENNDKKYDEKELVNASICSKVLAVVEGLLVSSNNGFSNYLLS